MSAPTWPAWQPPEAAPTDGRQFLARLSNGWRVIVSAPEGIRRGWSCQWWFSTSQLSLPYERSHSANTDWGDRPRITGWMDLPDA
jgi:hypothetical protein